MKLQHRMEYVKLFWKHDYPDDPVVIICEVDLDDERYAVRLIDIYADGHTSNQEDKAWGYVTEAPVETVGLIADSKQIQYSDDWLDKLIEKYNNAVILSGEL